MNSTKDLLEALIVAVENDWLTKEEAKDFARKVFAIDEKNGVVKK